MGWSLWCHDQGYMSSCHHSSILYWWMKPLLQSPLCWLWQSLPHRVALQPLEFGSLVKQFEISTIIKWLEPCDCFQLHYRRWLQAPVMMRVAWFCTFLTRPKLDLAVVPHAVMPYSSTGLTLPVYIVCFLLFLLLLFTLLLHSQLYLWGSPFWLRFLHMWPFFNPTIEVVTFRLCGWCMLMCFCCQYKCPDLLSPCDGMHVCTD